MGKRIPTIPFSGGKPLPGYEIGGEQDLSRTRPSVEDIEASLRQRFREAAHELEQRVDAQVRGRPYVALALAGGACLALGVVIGRPIARLLVLAAGGLALYKYAELQAEHAASAPRARRSLAR